MASLTFEKLRTRGVEEETTTEQPTSLFEMLKQRETTESLGVVPEEEKRPGLFSMATLKGEGGPTYPALEGGEETVVPNIVRTFGNIPSSATRMATPINPLAYESPVNLGGSFVRNVPKIVSTTKDI